MKRSVGVLHPRLVDLLAALAQKLVVHGLIFFRKLAGRQVKDRFADYFGQGFPQVFLEGLVASHINPLRILEENRHIDGVYHDIQELEAETGLLLGELEICDIGEGGVDLMGPVLPRPELRYRVYADPAVIVKLRVVHAHDLAPHLFPGLERDHGRMGVPGILRAVFMNGIPSRVNGGTARHLFQGEAQDPLRSGICGYDRALRVLVHHALGHGLKQGSVLFLALHEGFLGELPLRDVNSHAVYLHETAAVVPPVEGVPLQNSRLPVPAQQAHLEAPHVARFEGAEKFVHLGPELPGVKDVPPVRPGDNLRRIARYIFYVPIDEQGDAVRFDCADEKGIFFYECPVFLLAFPQVGIGSHSLSDIADSRDMNLPSFPCKMRCRYFNREHRAVFLPVVAYRYGGCSVLHGLPGPVRFGGKVGVFHP